MPVTLCNGKQVRSRTVTRIFPQTRIGFVYSMHLLWHRFDTLIQCQHVLLPGVSLISLQYNVLIKGESQHDLKSSAIYIPAIINAGLFCGQSMCKIMFNAP